MKPVLLDTSCIVALLDRSESFHERARDVVMDLHAPLMTCEPVIAEACYLLWGVQGAPSAVLSNVEKGQFELPLILSSEAQRIGELVKKYASVPMDLADACLVRLAELYETSLILTLDPDFSVYRWKKRRTFKNLLLTQGEQGVLCRYI